MREMFSEIWASISKNKLRTFLTGFSVAWGILMLIILLGTGNGLQNGILSNFEHMGTNTVDVRSWRTSEDYAGYPKGRRIRLTNRDIQIIRDEFPEVRNVAATDWYTDGVLTYGKNFVSIETQGVTSEMQKLVKIDITEGRFVNQLDDDARRKVIVIDQDAKDILFPNETAIGKTVIYQGIPFTVIGVYESMWRGSLSTCLIPVSTGQLLYRAGEARVYGISFELPTVTTDKAMEEFESRLIKRLAAEHQFSPTDESAVWINNSFEMFRDMNKVFTGIELFIWIIAIATLLAGIVGVSNIMLVTVRERTFEFGIRKALGAKPRSLIRLVLVEAVAITIVFGYVGMILGVMAMEMFNNILIKNAAQDTEGFGFSMFLNPTVNMSAALSATVVLVVAGVIAGYVPARKAAHIKTIDALRYNQ